ncbi:Rho-binding antiterminator [Pseudoalteromonas sp. T1lg23B]|uniref:Rho-binding antiterminator n=1 Tax=Pseudoalteromonas sp. T1lg23B TaxID=2077097 RepID=UPI000CF644A0|nr:Rho-binding antiterminator [Pseudoalteromonas sp. T1lg23B]
MLSCNEHDYIEIVCMYQYPVRLTLKTGRIVVGIAVDTKRNETRQECIQLKHDGQMDLVVLDEIVKLAVTVANPHISEITFSAS